MLNGRESLTVRQLIEALKQADPDAIVYHNTHDYDRDCWYDWSFSGINPNGELIYGEIMRSGDLCELVDEEDDSE